MVMQHFYDSIKIVFVVWIRNYSADK